MSNKFVVIDLETTGSLPKKGEKIIQFAAVVIENGIITEEFSSLINPQKSIPPFIEELTGINDEMVKDAPLFSEITDKVLTLLDGAYFVAHNVLFDLSFLHEELIQAGLEGYYGSVLDTVELARILYPTADGYKLSDLAEKENLNHNRPHQADSDARVTAELFLIMVKRLESLPGVTLNQLIQLSGGLKSDLDQLLDECVVEKEKNRERLADDIEIYQGLALKKIHVLDRDQTDAINIKYPSSDEEKIDIVKHGFEFFEKRTGQFKMMDTVYQSFLHDNHSLIEAGTGVGKSLAYLLPIAYFSKQMKQPVVVSTQTIQLQEQLLNREIPLLEKILPFKINAALLKGRNHYLSIEKFLQTLKIENDNYDTTLTKMQIIIWLTETETGDKDELNLSSGGLFYWNKIKNEQSYIEQNLEWQEHDFYNKAKRNAQAAEIIITNHSLLLCDIKEGGSILPSYEYVIVDEGHHLEKVASRFFGHTLDYLTTRLLINKFGLYEQNKLFYNMECLLTAMLKGNKELMSTIELNQIVENISYEMDELFKIIVHFVKKKSINKRQLNKVKVRVTNEVRDKERNALVHSAERFAFLLKDLSSAINNRLNWILKQTSLTNFQKNTVEELHLYLRDLNQLRSMVIECFMKVSNNVRWIEMDLRSPQNVTTIMAQPAFVTQQLKELFFQTKKSVVITSATLTVNQSFHYIMKEIGFNSDSNVQQIIPSPFDYKNQVQLLIPNDLPEINMVSLEDFVLAISEHIITIAEATKGRMLILFTAYDMLKKTYELIKESGFLNEYVLIGQGITSGSRTRLTKSFQRYDKAILFGTSSFWEGVDIPGEDLSCLVIVRLPFSPPEEPLTEAKCQLITEQGGNAFSDYSLPEAILRFKQGFGRLIRTEKDRGIMVVFDRRIVTTNYGKEFLKSIPAIPVKIGRVDELVNVIESWI